MSGEGAALGASGGRPIDRLRRVSAASRGVAWDDEDVEAAKAELSAALAALLPGDDVDGRVVGALLDFNAEPGGRRWLSQFRDALAAPSIASVAAEPTPADRAAGDPLPAKRSTWQPLTFREKVYGSIAALALASLAALSGCEYLEELRAIRAWDRQQSIEREGG